MRLATIRHRDGTSAALVTGTTAAPVQSLPGVAWGMDTPQYLTPGDSVTVTVDGIGALTNTVASP